MQPVTLIHVVFVGTQSCRVGARIVEQMASIERPDLQVAPIFLDSAAATVAHLPGAARHLFATLSTESRLAEMATGFPGQHEWTCSLADPSQYSTPREGQGHAHVPRNATIAFTADPMATMEFVMRCVRAARERQRADSIGGLASREVVLICGEPYGATAAGVLGPLGCLLRLEMPRIALYGACCMPTGSVARGPLLSEYRAKFYDLLATLEAAERGQVRLHPEVEGSPFDLLLIFDPARDGAVAGLEDLTDRAAGELAAAIATLPHLENRAVDCRSTGLQRPIVDDNHTGPLPRRLVLIGCETLVHDTAVIGRMARHRFLNSAASAAMGQCVGHERPVTTAVDGAMAGLRAVVAGLYRDLLGEFRDEASNVRAATLSSVRSRLDVVERSVDRRSESLPTRVVEVGWLEEAWRRHNDLLTAGVDVQEGIAAARAALGRLSEQETGHELRLEQAADVYRRIGPETPSFEVVREVEDEIGHRIQLRLAVAVRGVVSGWLDEMRALSRDLDLARTQLAAAVETPTVARDHTGGAQVLAAQKAIDAAFAPLMEVATSAPERREVARMAVSAVRDVEPVIGLLEERVGRQLAPFAGRSASAWAEEVFPDWAARHRLVQALASSLHLAELEAVMGVPERRYLWLMADEGFGQFRQALARCLPPEIHVGGEQPPQDLPGNTETSRLLVVAAWIGVAAGHLRLVEQCRADWQRLRSEGFGFAVTRQDVPPIPSMARSTRPQNVWPGVPPGPARTTDDSDDERQAHETSPAAAGA